MSIKSKLTTSIKLAVNDGLIDEKKHGALIEVAKKMAKRMDDPSFPMVDGKFDNVTESLYLKYCEKLHLSPPEGKPKSLEVKPGTIIGNSKWNKAANDE